MQQERKNRVPDPQERLRDALDVMHVAQLAFIEKRAAVMELESTQVRDAGSR